jgi:hypothetical protein
MLTKVYLIRDRPANHGFCSGSCNPQDSREPLDSAKSSSAAADELFGLVGFVCVVARSLRIAADTLLARAWHPNPFEANGMPPTYETTH